MPHENSFSPTILHAPVAESDPARHEFSNATVPHPARGGSLGRPAEFSSTVYKALDVLMILSSRPDGLQLPDIATMLNQPRTNVVRIVQTLQGYGLVTCDGRRWMATSVLRDWSDPARRHEVLRQRYAGLLDSIVSTTGELTVLGVHEGNGVTTIDSRDGRIGGLIGPRIGSRHGLRSSALGKLALSRRPDLVARFSDPELERELALITANGMAWYRDESWRHTVTIAFPGIGNGATEPMIAVVWPESRFTDQAAMRAADAVRFAVATVA